MDEVSERDIIQSIERGFAVLLAFDADLPTASLAELAEKGGAPDEIVERRGLRQVGDREALIPQVDAVLAAWPDKVQEYRGGKKGNGNELT